MPLVAVVVAAVLLASPWKESLPPMRSTPPPDDVRSVSIDFGVVTDPGTDWGAVDQHLDSAGANAVELNAGRVEFTAFDWAAYPEAAAEPGTDHLSTAARALARTSDGAQREFGLIVDAFVPRWLEQDPSLAGRSTSGETATYQASASALATGPVGDRLVAYVVALGERYEPAYISVTELFLDGYTFGEDDLALYREMTGAEDWPRDESGAVRRTRRSWGPGGPTCSPGSSRGCGPASTRSGTATARRSPSPWRYAWTGTTSRRASRPAATTTASCCPPSTG